MLFRSYDTKPVTASDNVDRGEYLTKIEEIETRLTELSDELITLKEENTQLKTNLETANNKISTLENNKDLSNLKTRVTKIETREDVLYKRFIDTTPSGSVQNIFHFMKEYKQNN